MTSLRPAAETDVPRIVELVQAAYRGQGGWTIVACGGLACYHFSLHDGRRDTRWCATTNMSGATLVCFALCSVAADVGSEGGD